jgi:hypothetical protein
VIDGFHKRLHERLMDKIESREAALLAGASSNTVDEVALRYVRDAAYMNALKDVLTLAHEIEADLYGDQAKKALQG